MKIIETKKDLRSFLRKKISGIPAAEKKKESSRIADRLFTLPEWKNNNLVLAFLSMEQEVQTGIILKQIRKEGKALALPKMYGDKIVFHMVPTLDTLSFDMHPYGIQEPKASLPIVIPSKENHALMVTPGLGFTPDGRRIGRGKGYYDRYLGEYGEYLDIVAVAFDCQMVQSIPTESFDKPVPVLITPSRLFRVNS